MKARKPVLKLRLLFNRQFASVAIMALALGMVMYGSTYVIPLFLAIISDYNAFQTGLVIFWMGVPAFLLMPALPLMIRKVDIRIAVGTGMLLMAISCFVSTSLTAESGGAVFTESQLIRGAGMILAMMFLNQATVASVAKEDAGDASGIFNAARNLGGSFALSALASFQGAGGERKAAGVRPGDRMHDVVFTNTRHKVLDWREAWAIWNERWRHSAALSSAKRSS